MRDVVLGTAKVGDSLAIERRAESGAVWFDPGMGMADDIRRQQEAEQRTTRDGAVQAEKAFDQLQAQISRIAPQCAHALRELGVKPMHKLGFMKYGWRLLYPLDLADESPSRTTIIVRLDGTWVFTADASKTKQSARAKWIEDYPRLPVRVNHLLSDGQVLSYMQHQVRGLSGH